MKKKIIFGIVCFVIGIILLTVAFLIKDKFKDETDNTNKVENKIVEFLIINYSYEDIDTNSVNLTFSVLNNGNKVGENERITVNFYQDDEVIYSAYYDIEEIDVNDEIGIADIPAFEHEKVTKCEFLHNGKVLKTYTTEEWSKEHDNSSANDEIENESDS